MSELARVLTCVCGGTEGGRGVVVVVLVVVV